MGYYYYLWFNNKVYRIRSLRQFYSALHKSDNGYVSILKSTNPNPTNLNINNTKEYTLFSHIKSPETRNIFSKIISRIPGDVLVRVYDPIFPDFMNELNIFQGGDPNKLPQLFDDNFNLVLV